MQRSMTFVWAFVLTLTLAALPATAAASEEGAGESAESASSNPRVVLETSKGDIVLELDAAKAPKTVENFLTYVGDGFYDGTVFHRVIQTFMIQGGGFNEHMYKRETRGPIENEADNGLSNARGTIAMARTGNPHSATAQFFINTVDNPRLDHTGKTPSGWGYAVFGKVVEGMEVVDAIAAVETARQGPMSDVPVETVVIEKARRLDGGEPGDAPGAESAASEG